MWDVDQYRQFADERHRPFYDLMARVRPQRPPELVVDIGCGDGPLTLSLADRWPTARIVGVDSSAQMLDAARAADPDGRVEWHEAGAEQWRPDDLGAPIDVLVTNAALQWVPTHRELLPRWTAHLSPSGWLALQVPGNCGAPTHRLMREVAARHTRSAELPRLERAAASDNAIGYLNILASAGLRADAWETTYVHVLDPSGQQACPPLEWVRGTGLRPVLEVLTDRADVESFLAEYERELSTAYPRMAYGVPFEFRRIFAVGHRA